MQVQRNVVPRRLRFRIVAFAYPFVACHANVLGFGGSAMPGLDTIDLCALRIASDAARKALEAVG
jgi:hypothetical protein